MRKSLLAIFAVLIDASATLAQGGPTVTPSVPGDSVPVWVFYWVLGLSTSVGGALLLVIKTLWERSDRVSGLSESERGQLRQLYDWHNKVDENQVLLWYVPRDWRDLIEDLKADQESTKDILTKLVGQSDEVNADLREQLKDRLRAHDLQQTKILKLALRVQQAVEALAGLTPPSIESDLDDTGSIT